MFIERFKNRQIENRNKKPAAPNELPGPAG